MKLTDLTLDLESVDNGAWIDDLPDLEGVSFRVRGSEYQPYTRALRAAMAVRGRKELARARAGDTSGYDATTRKLAAEHLLLDWKGIESDDGKPIPFTAALALEVMTERQYRPLQRGVLEAIDRVDNGLAEHREDAEGN